MAGCCMRITVPLPVRQYRASGGPAARPACCMAAAAAAAAALHLVWFRSMAAS